MATVAGAAVPKYVRRVLIESQTASVAELGIYMEPLQLDASARLPLHQFAALVSLHPHAVPHLLKVEWVVSYPMGPPTIKFMSRVPHPLITDDDSIDVDILGTEWSPILSTRAVLVALQSVLANPMDADVFREGCIRNADWEHGAFATPPDHAPILFDLLLKAAQTPVNGVSPDWLSWRFLRGLRSLLCMHPLAYKTLSRGWYEFLRSLSIVSVTLRGCTAPADPGARDEAKQLWIREMQALLKKHFCFDGLRMILCMRSLGSEFGNMQRIQRLWSMVREFLTDIRDEELFANNRIVLRLVERAGRCRVQLRQ